jgi:hypothetical protein
MLARVLHHLHRRGTHQKRIELKAAARIDPMQKRLGRRRADKPPKIAAALSMPQSYPGQEWPAWATFFWIVSVILSGLPMVPAGKIWNLTLPPVSASACLPNPWAKYSRCGPPGHDVAVRMGYCAWTVPPAKANAASAPAMTTSRCLFLPMIDENTTVLDTDYACVTRRLLWPTCSVVALTAVRVQDAVASGKEASAYLAVALSFIETKWN